MVILNLATLVSIKDMHVNIYTYVNDIMYYMIQIKKRIQPND